jgi:activating signal cointegrator complex subunit 1
MTSRTTSITPLLAVNHRHTLLHKTPTTTLANTMRRKRQQNSRHPPSHRKPPLTHFLCLPLVTPSSRPQLETSIETFRSHVSPNQPEQTTNVATRIHPKAIRPVGVLHCTLGVMSLDGPTLQKAIDLLQNLDINSLLSSASPTSNPSLPTPWTLIPTKSNKPATHGQPITISLTGLSSMHSPTNTSILYIPPSDPTQRLYPFCLSLQKLFQNEGLLLPDNRELKLHATIVNTIYAKGRKKRAGPKRKGSHGGEPSPGSGEPGGLVKGKEDDEEDRSQGHGPHSNAPLKFDARRLLEEYKNFVWAEGVVLDRIAICEMGAKKLLGVDGEVVGEEYTEVASVGLPVVG